jgi:hypothetical protein
MEIAGSKYEAIQGLMELLTKKDPDTELCIKEDFDDYKEIILNSNALYQGFEPTRDITQTRKTDFFETLSSFKTCYIKN